MFGIDGPIGRLFGSAPERILYEGFKKGVHDSQAVPESPSRDQPFQWAGDKVESLDSLDFVESFGKGGVTLDETPDASTQQKVGGCIECQSIPKS